MGKHLYASPPLVSPSPLFSLQDLNEYNHAVQRFANKDEYEKMRVDHCLVIVENNAKVEDAITGNTLNIKDQLVKVDVKASSQGATNRLLGRAVSDVITLTDILLTPSPRRSSGEHPMQPLLMRAGPGTGKTWMCKQAVWMLAERLQSTNQWKGVRLVPLVMFVQQIIYILRDAKAGTEERGRALFDKYVQHVHTKHADMLKQSWDLRALIIILDGVDEAAGMRPLIEDFVLNGMVASGNRVMITSRIEGIANLEPYQACNFSVLDLKELTNEQQRAVIRTQMDGNEFFDHLLALGELRRGMEAAYLSLKESSRTLLESLYLKRAGQIEGGGGQSAEDPAAAPATAAAVGAGAGAASVAGSSSASQQVAAADATATAPATAEATDAPAAAGAEAGVSAANDAADSGGGSSGGAQDSLSSAQAGEDVSAEESAAGDGGLDPEVQWTVLEELIKVAITEGFEWSERQAVMEGGGEEDAEEEQPGSQDPTANLAQFKIEEAKRRPDDAPSQPMVAQVSAKSGKAVYHLIFRLLGMLDDEQEEPTPVAVEFQGGESATMCMLGMQNRFIDLDPAHYRYANCHVRVQYGSFSFSCVIEAHVTDVLRANMASIKTSGFSGADHYNYFKVRLVGGAQGARQAAHGRGGRCDARAGARLPRRRLRRARPALLARAHLLVDRRRPDRPAHQPVQALHAGHPSRHQQAPALHLLALHAAGHRRLEAHVQ